MSLTLAELLADLPAYAQLPPFALLRAGHNDVRQLRLAQQLHRSWGQPATGIDTVGHNPLVQRKLFSMDSVPCFLLSRACAPDPGLARTVGTLHAGGATADCLFMRILFRSRGCSPEPLWRL